ncbi:MAG: pyridoxamine 5'-phosphate oxidase family protein [Sulfitobacter sp.]
MSDPNDLAAFLDTAWRHLRRGVADAKSPARYPTFATTGPEGMPQVRTVALRGAERSAATVEVHTDVVADKVTALRTHPLASLHVWLPRADLQIRLQTTVDILHGPEVEAQWAQVPAASRVSYGTAPDPGTPIDHVYAYEKPAERARFAVLRCRIEHIDLVHLDTRHRRAVFVRADGWRGTWVAP